MSSFFLPAPASCNDISSNFIELSKCYLQHHHSSRTCELSVSYVTCSLKVFQVEVSDRHPSKMQIPDEPLPPTQITRNIYPSNSWNLSDSTTEYFQTSRRISDALICLPDFIFQKLMFYFIFYLCIHISKLFYHICIGEYICQKRNNFVINFDQYDNAKKIKKKPYKHLLYSAT